MVYLLYSHFSSGDSMHIMEPLMFAGITFYTKETFYFRRSLRDRDYHFDLPEDMNRLDDSSLLSRYARLCHRNKKFSFQFQTVSIRYIGLQIEAS